MPLEVMTECFDRAVNTSHSFFQVRGRQSPIYMVYFSLSQRILRLPDRVINRFGGLGTKKIRGKCQVIFWHETLVFPVVRTVLPRSG